MIKLLKFASTATLTIFATTCCSHAAISFTIDSGVMGEVSMTVEASGFATGTNDNFLVVGTEGDTFLGDGAPQRFSGLVPAAPTPDFTLGGVFAQNNFYRDNNSSGNDTGLDSILGFYFGENVFNGVLDLSDLNGTYRLPESIFTDFVPGTYVGLISGSSPTTLQGLGEISLRVVPEPSVSLLVGIGALLITRRHRVDVRGEHSGNASRIRPIANL